MYAANDAGNTAMALYLTVVSGYLILAYTAGASLNRLQISIVNSLFIFFSGGFVYSSFVSFLGMLAYQNAAANVGRETPTTETAESTSLTIFLVAQLAGILAALIFMADVRRRGKGGDA